MDHNEIWRDVPRYEGLYQVSDLGRVRSLDRVAVKRDGRRHPTKGRILRLCPNSRGYLSLVLHRGGHERSCLVHHLVALAFLGDRPKSAHVHHLDGNKRNNTLINLEYVNASLHNFYHITEGDKAGFMPILTVDQVVEVKTRLAAGETCKRVAASSGVNYWTVRNIKSGRRWAWVGV